MNKRENPRYVIGPYGPLTVADLPLHNTKRWTAIRKAKVVVAVRGGLIARDEAIARYRLTVEEFESWDRALRRSGVAGLYKRRTKRS